MVMTSALTDGCTVNSGNHWQVQTSATQQEPAPEPVSSDTALLQE
jgi:hypothetical protein